MRGGVVVLLLPLAWAACPSCPPLKARGRPLAGRAGGQGSEQNLLLDCMAKLEQAAKAGDLCQATAAGSPTGQWTVDPCDTGAGCQIGCQVLDGETRLVSVALAGRLMRGFVCGELGEMPRLRGLDLSGNQLSGHLPNALGSSNLSAINIAGNRISGTIPTSWAQLPLESFALGNNSGLCGSEWLGAIGQPVSGGSRGMLAAVEAGGGYNSTRIGQGCEYGDELGLVQVLWTGGFGLLALIFVGWALHSPMSSR